MHTLPIQINFSPLPVQLYFFFFRQKYAVRHAKKGRCVIMAGKSTEKYQLPFPLPSTSDVNTVRYICQNEYPYITG